MSWVSIKKFIIWILKFLENLVIIKKNEKYDKYINLYNIFSKNLKFYFW